MFWRFDSEYRLAKLSIEALKADRIGLAISYYEALTNAFPETKYLEQATDQKNELEDLPINLNNKS